MIAWIPVMIGAIIFPYTKKILYSRTEMSKHIILGIPLITIAGIFGLLAVCTLTAFLLFDPVAAGPSIHSLGTVFILFFTGTVWYTVVKRIRKRKENIDITKAFDEIPID